MTMDAFNVGRILAGLNNPELYLRKIKQDGIQGEQTFNSTFSQARPNSPQNPLNSLVLNNMLQMNQIAAMDRSVYIKNLLGLPQTLSSILLACQGKTPLTMGSLIPPGFDESMLTNQKALAKIFNDEQLTPDKIQNRLSQQIIQQQAAAQNIHMFRRRILLLTELIGIRRRNL